MPPADWALSSLEYEFRNPGLLEQALTHKSAASQHNERLEFLGDSVLGLVITHLLYQARPDADEGALSRLRASLVKRATLSELAAEIGLGEKLRLGSGELKSGGQHRDSILADTLEAILGAVYLDGGHEAAEAVVLNLYRAKFLALPDDQDLKDSKTRLQEELQGQGLSPPRYTVTEVTGAAHAQQFEVACQVESMHIETSGSGTSRRVAEQQAAERALELLADGERDVS